MPTRVGRTSFVYDAAGRVVRTVTKRISKKPLVRSFYYATGAQPIGFDSSDQPGVGYRYVYDGLKRRVAKETIDTTTGNVTERVVFVHAGDQLVAEHTTVGADRGRGFVWTIDPGTGEIIGQITLTPQANSTGSRHRGGDYPHGDALRGDVLSWSQDEVDAEFFAIVTDLAGAPHEIIHPDTGDIVGTATQTLYGQRTWRGEQSSPLLFAGQYADVESGWAYNRFRYYNPHAGIYNAQDPLGAPPRLASAQGYVDHAAFWVDEYGLKAYGKSIVDTSIDMQKQVNRLHNSMKPRTQNSVTLALARGRNPDTGEVFNVITSSEETIKNGTPSLRREVWKELDSSDFSEVLPGVSDPQMRAHAEVNALKALEERGATEEMIIVASRPVCEACQKTVFGFKRFGNPFTTTLFRGR